MTFKPIINERSREMYKAKLEQITINQAATRQNQSNKRAGADLISRHSSGNTDRSVSFMEDKNRIASGQASDTSLS